MNPSRLLRRWLDSGKRPSSQREASALLDESRSLLVSKLPTTGEIMMNFTEAELDSVDMKSGNVLQQMHKIYAGKQKANAANLPPPSASPAKPSPARTAPTATAKPSPVIHRATSTATKPTKPTSTAASATVATVTAAQFAKPELRMNKAEFDKLTTVDKSRFCVSGGKLI